jgi:hypothetical protein
VWAENVNLHLKELSCEDGTWMEVVRDVGQCRALALRLWNML